MYQEVITQKFTVDNKLDSDNDIVQLSFKFPLSQIMLCDINNIKVKTTVDRTDINPLLNQILNKDVGSIINDYFQPSVVVLAINYVHGYYRGGRNIKAHTC